MTKVLVSLLALQVILAAAIFLSKQQKSDFDTDQALLEIVSAQVDKIIVEGESASAVLEKSGDRWILPELEGLPVTSSKVDDIIAKLSDVKRGWPVASSKSSHTRLEVAEDTFQRKVSLSFSGGEEKQLIMGTSPGYRSIHARMHGEDDIYTVNLATYDFPDSDDSWLDRSLLDIDDFTQISGVDVAIEKVESQWQLVSGPAALAEEGLLDPEKVEQITGLFQDMTVLGVADDSPEAGDAIDVTVAGPQGDWTYQFFNDEEKSYVRRNDRETVFRVSKSTYEKVSEFTREHLLLEDQPIAEEGEAVEPANG